MKRIGGAGGGGKGGGAGGGRVAQEAPDSLRSNAYARVLDLVCEGEIEGLVDGAKSIYLNETPLLNADGTSNFSGATWTERKGTQGQAYIPGFPSVESTINVGVEVTASTPVVRQFTNPNLSAVSVTIGVPQLTLQNTSNGDISGTSVSVAVDVQSNGGGFVRQELNGRGTIRGKTTSRYQRSFRIPLTGSPPWDIRVVRESDDSTTAALQNKTWWDAATEIIDAKLRYPNSAIVALSVDASQFSSIPRRAYRLRLLRVRVPTNYNPTTRVYTGPWDGNFQIAWTDNPAWCFFDLVTSDRYGLGQFVDPSQVDKWALYTIGRYCDELVPDGLGGTEPRFRCNLYLQSRAEAFKVVGDMASIFRGLVFWQSGAITAVQDSPSPPAYLYTQANVIDGAFSYSGSSAKARHTVALVTWNDPEDFYRQKVEYVDDEIGVARFGVITTEIAAVGCTSRGQANRVGRWLLFSERLEAETVTFKVGIEGMLARPGQVIRVADAGRAGVRLGGRIVSGSAAALTLDAPVTLTAGVAYTLSALRANGTVMETMIQHSGGTLSSVTLAPPLPEAPQTGSVWVIGSALVEPQTFRVLAVGETEKHEFEITALAHEPDKFAFVENGLALEARQITALSAAPAAPTGLSVTESLFRSASGIQTRMSVSWQQVEGATSYAVSYQPNQGNVSPEMVVFAPSVDINEVPDGVYTIRVAAINGIGSRSPAASVGYQVLGRVSPPANVQNFYVARNGSVLNFTWRHVDDIDLDYYEIRQGEAWRTGFPVGATSANAFSLSSPRGGSFMVKAIDSSGIESASEALIVAADISGINVLLVYDDKVLNWPGAFDDAYRLGGGVTVSNNLSWSTYTGSWTSYARPWVFLDPAASGTYTTQPVDVGLITTAPVYIDTLVELLSTVPPWSEFDLPWSAYAAPEWTWQGRASGLTASYEIRVSDDNVSWSTWQPFVPGAYRLRYLQIRVTLGTDDIANLPYMTELVVKVDVPDRVEHFEDVAVPPAGVTLSFAPHFVGVQTVQVTLQSAASGDRFTVTGKSNSGVTVRVFDETGAAKVGVVDVDVFGYGERF